jgi:hypothetical protein
MDAKVLRAAVSAAIRVTVSTSLIGCGGSVSGESAGAANDGGKPAAMPSKAQGANAGGNAGAGWGWSPKPSDGATPPTSGGTASGSSNSGGITSTTPEGGNDVGGNATAGTAGAAEGGDGPGAPTDPCSAMTACMDRLDADALLATPGTIPCCQMVIDGLMELRDQISIECWVDLNGRFLMSKAHQTCCTALSEWEQPACTPWGPPVPPELPESALLGWGAAA